MEVMKLLLFFLAVTFVNFAYAEPSTYRGHCLNALADLEFGEKRDSKFEMKASVPSGASYVWSGNKIRSDESGFFKRSSRVVWSLEDFKKTGDGRMPSAPKKEDQISAQELKAIQAAFIRLGFSRLNYVTNDPKQSEQLEKIFAACESVDDVQTKEGVSISKASLQRRGQVHHGAPDLFGPVKSAPKAGSL